MKVLLNGLCSKFSPEGKAKRETEREKKREGEGQEGENKHETINKFPDVGGGAEGQSDQKHVENSRARQSSEKSKIFSAFLQTERLYRIM